MIRKPIVSGQFYPEEVSELRKALDNFKPHNSIKRSAAALILPHAGYMYSGKVAVATVNAVLPRKRIIILGPNHTGYGENFGLWPKGKWNMPLADIEIDEELSTSILASGATIVPDQLSHKFEHSIEVELPILYHFFGEFKFVPIVCQVSALTDYENAAAQIYSAIKNIKDEVMLVASSDMTHYEPDSSARRKDRLALEHIINIDVQSLLKTVEKDNISMCGVAPVAVTLLIMKKIGVKKAQVSLYQTSADSGGGLSSVVGYAGVTIS